MKYRRGKARFVFVGRALRIEFPGACYHVLNRGNYKQNLFLSEGAAKAFERTLGEAAIRFGWAIHAYVIMSTHYHLAVELTEPNLSRGMAWLQGTWIRRYNRFRGWVGRPFQGRYRSILAEPGLRFARVCHYIHLNPVRARLLPVDQLRQYHASSFAKFSSKARPTWLEPTTVLKESGQLPDTPGGWKQYLAYLTFISEDPSLSKELIAKKLSRGWCLGSPEFRDQMRRESRCLGREIGRQRFVGLDIECLREERERVWEMKLQELARVAKIDLLTLPPKKSAREKLLLGAALKQTTSVNNGWLARRLNLGHETSVGPFLTRWRRAPAGARATEHLLSRV